MSKNGKAVGICDVPSLTNVNVEVIKPGEQEVDEERPNHDSNGRFKKGNKAAVGNPLAPYVQKFRRMMFECARPERFKESFLLLEDIAAGRGIKFHDGEKEIFLPVKPIEIIAAQKVYHERLMGKPDAAHADGPDGGANRAALDEAILEGQKKILAVMEEASK